MANFDDQVMGLTGLTISGSSTAPSQTELATFLNDGVKDIINKSILMNPQSAEEFSRESAEQTSNGFNPGTTKIISVLREAGIDGRYYPCTKSSIDLQYRVTDIDSLHYASKYNPVYMISQNRNVHVFPIPTGAGNDGFKVLYVNYSPEESDGTALEHSSSGIKWFPDDKVYLVVLYAAAMSCLSKASSIHDNLPSVPSAPTNVSSPPSFNVTFTENLPIAPEIYQISTPTITVPTVPTAPASLTLPTEAGSLTLPNVPVFNAPSIPFSLTDVNSQIGNEDMDMIDKEFEKIDKNFNKFEKDLDIAKQEYEEEINEFNKEFDRLDKNNERSINAKVSTYRENVTKYEKDIGKYNGELSSYTAQIQKYLADVNKFEKETTLDISLFSQELGRYNAALSKYQADLSSFQTELQTYNSEITSFQADLGKYGSEIQSYTSELNRHVTDYQWYTQRHQILLTQYLAGFPQSQGQPAAVQEGSR